MRPEDSASDESAQAAVQSTVTTQISQARLFTEANINMQQASSNSMVIALSTGASAPRGHGTGTVVGDGVLSHQQSQQQLRANTNTGSLRRLHSIPSESDNEFPPASLANGGGVSSSIKPPIPERNADLITKVGHKRIPPPPPPRTSSRSPLASPTTPNVPQSIVATAATSIESVLISGDNSSGNDSSGNESGNDHVQRQVALEMRHQELLKKQKLLQEQYQRLQQMSKLPSVDISCSSQENVGVKQLGSETVNIQQKIAALNLACESSGGTAVATETAAATNGVLISDATGGVVGGVVGGGLGVGGTVAAAAAGSTSMTTKQVYETEIL